MLIRKYLIPILAVAGTGLAIYTVRSENKPIKPALPVAEPARSPFKAFVAGAGIIEASSQNIAIGTPAAGVIWTVPVKVGDKVKAGSVLFTVDDRAAKALLASRRAELKVAEGTLSKLRSMPRPEEVPAAEARVREAEASLTDLRAQLGLWESVQDKRAVAQDELNRKKYAVAAGEARLEQAKSDLALLKAGAWGPDIGVAEAQVASARAQVEAAATDLDRLAVRAPIDCTVMQVNVRVGEFANAGANATPLMMVGDLDTLVVRTDVDENDAWRVRAGAKARGALRGNAEIGFDLEFVRVEPYVVPKKSLTGDSSERVDTRVLQVLYAFKRGDSPVYAGQQVDVFIDAPPRQVESAGKGGQS